MSNKMENSDWVALIEKHRRSGLTQRAFCKVNNISYSTFKNKLYKLNKSSTAIIPVSLSEPNKCGISKITLTNNVELSFPPNIPWSRYADDGVLHCRTNKQARYIMDQLKQRFEACGLEMNSSKSSIVCCANTNQSWVGDKRSFDYLGYTFRVRRSENSKTGKISGNFLPGVSRDALNAMRRVIRKLKIHRWTNCSIEEIANKINPIIQGWINYYAVFTRTAFYSICRQINMKLVKWARNKYKSLKNHKVRAIMFLEKVYANNKDLFAHWRCGMVRSFV